MRRVRVTVSSTSTSSVSVTVIVSAATAPAIATAVSSQMRIRRRNFDLLELILQIFAELFVSEPVELLTLGATVGNHFTGGATLLRTHGAASLADTVVLVRQGGSVDRSVENLDCRGRLVEGGKKIFDFCS